MHVTLVASPATGAQPAPGVIAIWSSTVNVEPDSVTRIVVSALVLK
jgi:hypothetical protein